MSRMIRVAFIAVIAAAACFVTATAASAHNVLETTSPANGATVEKAPQKIVLTFDKPAEQMGTTLAVSGPDGAAKVSDATLVNDTVEVTIGGDLPAGKYTVKWRVTSADGHPVSGTFAFSTKQPASYQDPSGSGKSSGTQSGSKQSGNEQDSGSNSQGADSAQGDSAQDRTQSATSTSSGTLGAILIVIGVALVIIILIVIGVLTLRRRRPSE